MSLPNLPELPNLDELEKEFSQPEIKKQAEPTRKAKSTKRAGPTKKTERAEKTKLASNESAEPKNGKKKKPKIPKSKYDDEGNPILMIPNLDYIALNSEIDRFFGNYEEDD